MSTELIGLAVASAIATYGLAFPVRRILIRWNVVDTPTARSSHIQPTARGGGLAIVATVCLGAVVLRQLQGGTGALAAVLLATVLLAAVSFSDDLWSIAPFPRLALQALAAGLALTGLGWSGVAQGFSEEYLPHLAPYWAVPLLLLWVTGYTNAFNFMDGINGIAGTQAVVTAVGACWIVRGGHTVTEPVALAAVVAGSAAGFLPHNFPRARMFMGDVGSATLGFLLAIITIWLGQERGWWLFVPLVLLHANFVLDTGITLLRRVLRRERWYEPHREHFYQRLVRAGRSHTFVTTSEVCLQVVAILLLSRYQHAGPGLRVALVLLTLGLWGGFFVYCELALRRHTPPADAQPA